MSRLLQAVKNADRRGPSAALGLVLAVCLSLPALAQPSPPDAQAEAQAVALSRAGYEAGKEGRHAEAVTLLSRAINSSALSLENLVVAYNNRALAYSGLGRRGPVPGRLRAGHPAAARGPGPVPEPGQGPAVQGPVRRGPGRPFPGRGAFPGPAPRPWPCARTCTRTCARTPRPWPTTTPWSSCGRTCPRATAAGAPPCAAWAASRRPWPTPPGPSNFPPDQASLYYNRAIILTILNDHAGALADLDRSLELDPNSAYARYRRGLVRKSLGQAEAGEADIREALRLHRGVAAEVDGGTR